MIEEYLIRCFESKTFSGSVVEPLHYKLDFLLSDCGEVTLLRKVLANETIHILVSSSLPGCVWMGKIDISTKVTSNSFMFRKLFAIIRRDGMGSDRQRLQELDNSISHSSSCLALDLSQEGQARLPLGQGDNSMTMPFPDNRIHLPITQSLTSINDSGSLIDAYSVFELSTPIVASVAFPALFPWSGSSTGIVGGNEDFLQHVYL